MLKIATRGSKLALVQANMVANLLKLPHEICVIQTTGDICAQESLKTLGGKEVFTREIDQALLNGSADIAVHSLKDVPGILHEDLEIIATLTRADVRDVLVGAASFAQIPHGAKFGTSSPRRMAQVLNIRPDLEVIEFRGNVETRLEKIQNGVASASILAAAGLHRLGIELTMPHQYLNNLTPAIGQGIICIIAKCGKFNFGHINHQPTFIAATAERAVLKAFGGNCYTPLAAHAIVTDKIEMSGFVASDDYKKCFSAKISGAIADAEKLGCQLAKTLLDWKNDFSNQTN